MKKLVLIILLALSLHAPAVRGKPLYNGIGSLSFHTGAAIPIGEMGERMKVSLPWLSLSYRFQPRPKIPRLLLEFEAGFYGYKSNAAVGGKRAKLFAEPMLVKVMPAFNPVKGLFILPKFGLGMNFNQVTNSASIDYRNSNGAYNHIICAPELEFLYRIAERVSISVRIRGLFSFDKDRVFYHLIPDAGASVYF